LKVCRRYPRRPNLDDGGGDDGGGFHEQTSPNQMFHDRLGRTRCVCDDDDGADGVGAPHRKFVLSQTLCFGGGDDPCDPNRGR
jgi:hypothetical protein